jgi:hypothetical protein
VLPQDSRGIIAMTYQRELTTAEKNRTLPRADPADVQRVVDLWKQKNKIVGKADEQARGDFRVFCYKARDHYFTPHDVFDPRSWSVEDVRVCLEALQSEAPRC